MNFMKSMLNLGIIILAISSSWRPVMAAGLGPSDEALQKIFIPLTMNNSRPPLNRIVYIAGNTPTHPVNDIYLIDPDGSNKVQLTSSSAIDFYDPKWSPDGSKIIVSGIEEIDGVSIGRIWVMNPDGSGLKALTSRDAPSDSPSWSPDGTKIVYTKRMSKPGPVYAWNVFTMNSDGSNPTNLIQAIEADNSPSWSPDGKKIAYRACQMPAPYYLLINCQINVMNLADRSIANLSGPTKTDDGHPQWSPDGKKIVFVRNMIYRGYISDFFYELFVMDADGSKLLQITNDPSRNNQAFSPGWSPNGTRIIFTHFGMDGDSGIYTINNDGSGIAAIFTTQSPGGPREPDWK